MALLAGLAIGWEELLDTASGAPYYYNASTGVVQWERPEAEKAVDVEATRAEALCAAAEAGDFPTLLWQLWQVGVPVNATRPSGQGALHAAALSSSPHAHHITELLLQNGADADAVDLDGQSALLAAAAASMPAVSSGP